MENAASYLTAGHRVVRRRAEHHAGQFHLGTGEVIHTGRPARVLSNRLRCVRQKATNRAAGGQQRAADQRDGLRNEQSALHGPEERGHRLFLQPELVRGSVPGTKHGRVVAACFRILVMYQRVY